MNDNPKNGPVVDDHEGHKWKHLLISLVLWTLIYFLLSAVLRGRITEDVAENFLRWLGFAQGSAKEAFFIHILTHYACQIISMMASWLIVIFCSPGGGALRKLWKMTGVVLIIAGVFCVAWYTTLKPFQQEHEAAEQAKEAHEEAFRRGIEQMMANKDFTGALAKISEMESNTGVSAEDLRKACVQRKDQQEQEDILQICGKAQTIYEDLLRKNLDPEQGFRQRLDNLRNEWNKAEFAVKMQQWEPARMSLEAVLKEVPEMEALDEQRKAANESQSKIADVRQRAVDSQALSYAAGLWSEAEANRGLGEIALNEERFGAAQYQFNSAEIDYQLAAKLATDEKQLESVRAAYFKLADTDMAQVMTKYGGVQWDYIQKMAQIAETNSPTSPLLAGFQYESATKALMDSLENMVIVAQAKANESRDPNVLIQAAQLSYQYALSLNKRGLIEEARKQRDEAAQFNDRAKDLLKGSPFYYETPSLSAETSFEHGKMNTTQKDKVLVLLKSRQGRNFYVVPNIPPKKMANIAELISIPPDHEPLAVLDTTLLGSSKYFLLITTGGIYFRNSPSNNNSGGYFLSVTNFQRVTFEMASWWDGGIFIGGTHFDIGSNRISRKNLVIILEAIRRALEPEKDLSSQP